MVKNVALMLHIRPELDKRLEALAKAMDRPKSWVCEHALEEFASIHEPQVAEILKGLEEADAGDFASQEDVEAVLRKWPL